MEGGYYDLFKFFSEAHNLILVDTEIQDIITAVKRFNEQKRIEAQQEADWELDDDDAWEGDDTCPACGGEDGNHMKGCPEDYSPFAELIRNGYD